MTLTILTGSANPGLAEAVAQKLGLTLAGLTLERFPDGELHVEIEESVRGKDVYLIQPTSPPVDEHLIELLFLADACRRAGATHITAVVPYFGYARQDRRATGREPVAARLIADVIEVSGLQRLVAIDVHSAALEGFFRIPLEHLSAVPVLVEALRPYASEKSVVVSPDLGAVKLAHRYASMLNLPVAIVHKMRISGEEVRVQRIVGEVEGMSPIIVDDMISTGGTVEAAAKALLAAGCLPRITVSATHALLVGPAMERLDALPMQHLITTDSVSLPEGLTLPTEVVSLAPILARAVKSLHSGATLADLVVYQ